MCQFCINRNSKDQMDETQLHCEETFIEEREDILEELEHVCVNKDVVLSLNYKNLIKLPDLIAVRSQDYQHVSRIYLKGNLLQTLVWESDYNY